MYRCRLRHCFIQLLQTHLFFYYCIWLLLILIAFIIKTNMFNLLFTMYYILLHRIVNTSFFIENCAQIRVVLCNTKIITYTSALQLLF